MNKRSLLIILGNSSLSGGLGILLHDYFHDMYVIGGYKEILSIQGGYIGLIILIIGWIILNYILVIYNEEEM